MTTDRPAPEAPGLARHDDATSALDRDSLGLVLTLGQKLVGELDLGAVFRLVAEAAYEVVEAELLMVPMVDAGGQTYTYRVAHGEHAELLLDQTFGVSQGACGWVMSHRRPLIFGEGVDYELVPTARWEPGVASSLMVPMFGREGVIGGLSASGKRGGRSFTVRDLHMLTLFANQAGAAIENARLVTSLRREQDRLRASQQSFEQLFRHAPSPLLTVDSDGLVTRANRGAEVVFGRQVDALVGRRFASLFGVPTPPLGACLAGEGGASGVATLLRGDGAQRLAEVGCAPLPIEGGVGYAVSVVDVTDRVAAQRSTERSLREKATLLQEIHHRVKNNLQIVCSLLSLQSERLTSDEARTAIDDSVCRVRSMALIHQQLYGMESLAYIELGQYAEALAASLRQTLAPHTSVVVSAVPVEVTIDQAVPLGLILNEALTNAFKYGAPRREQAAPPPDGRAGDVEVRLRLESERLYLSVHDSGPGLPTGLAWKTSPTLGLQLIRTLSRQLRGSFGMRFEGGLVFELQCPLRAGEAAPSSVLPPA